MISNPPLFLWQQKRAHLSPKSTSTFLTLLCLFHALSWHDRRCNFVIVDPAPITFLSLKLTFCILGGWKSSLILPMPHNLQAAISVPHVCGSTFPKCAFWLGTRRASVKQDGCICVPLCLKFQHCNTFHLCNMINIRYKCIIMFWSGQRCTKNWNLIIYKNRLNVMVLFYFLLFLVLQGIN